MEKLKKFLDKYLDDLLKSKFKDQKELLFFANFENEINSTDIKKFMKIDRKAFLILYSRTYINDISFDEIIEIINEFYTMFEEYIVEILKHTKTASEIFQSVKEKILIKYPFLEEALDVFLDYMRAEAIYSESINFVTKEILNKINIEEKKEKIKKRYMFLKNEKNKHDSKIKKEWAAINKLFRILGYGPKDVIDIDLNLFKNISPEAEYEILRAIILLNQNYYVRYSKHNKKFTDNDIYEIDKIFLKYNLNFNNFNDNQKNIIKKYFDIHNISSLLNLIVKSPFKNELYTDFGVNMLVNSNEKIMLNIIHYIEKGHLTVEFIKNHGEFIIEKLVYDNGLAPSYKKLLKNMNLLESINYDFKDLDILLLEPADVQKIMEICGLYKLKINKNVYEKVYLIDSLIEINMYSYLINHPEFVNILDENIIKRIKIANQIGFNIYNKKGNLKECILTGNKFYLSDEELDECIIKDTKNVNFSRSFVINDKLFNNKIVEKLENDYKVDDFTYDIEGITISRLKVLSIANNLILQIDDNDLLLQIITNNSFLSDKDIAILKNNLFKNNKLLIK